MNYFEYGFFSELVKTAEKGKVRAAIENALDSPTGSPETLKDELVDMGLSVGGGISGALVGKLLDKAMPVSYFDDEENSLGLNRRAEGLAALGAALGPGYTMMKRQDKKLAEKGKKAKLSRLQAAALSGLLGAGAGAALPTRDGVVGRLLNALTVGGPAAAIGSANSAIFGTVPAK